MIPAALSTMLQQGVADFLRMSFWSSTPGMEDVIERFVQAEGADLQGPLRLGEAAVPAGEGHGSSSPHVPLGYPAHLHQERRVDAPG
jgi:hypothetical protein